MLAIWQGLVRVPVLGYDPEKGVVMGAYLEVWTPAGRALEAGG